MRCMTLTIVLAAVVLWVGCEKDSDTRNRSFSIQPNRATLSLETKTLILRAVGGEPPYVWSVSDTSFGDVSSSDSAVATYTRLAPNGANTVRVTDGRNWKAEMIVIQETEQ